MDIALQINNLGKVYGKHQVLENISFTVVKGEIFALLGTNGAGKTTTLECLEGIRRYDTGKILINGKLGVQLQHHHYQRILPLKKQSCYLQNGKILR